MGRPKKGDIKPDSFFEVIVVRIAEGESLREICRDVGVSHCAFFKRIKVRPELEKLYREALEIKMDIWSDDIIAIADETKNDWYTDATGAKRINSEVVKRSELKIKTRQWNMERMSRRKYHLPTALTGPEGGPIPIEVNVMLKALPAPEVLKIEDDDRDE